MRTPPSKSSGGLSCSVGIGARSSMSIQVTVWKGPSFRVSWLGTSLTFRTSVTHNSRSPSSGSREANRPMKTSWVIWNKATYLQDSESRRRIPASQADNSEWQGSSGRGQRTPLDSTLPATWPRELGRLRCRCLGADGRSRLVRGTHWIAVVGISAHRRVSAESRIRQARASWLAVALFPSMLGSRRDHSAGTNCPHRTNPRN